MFNDPSCQAEGYTEVRKLIRHNHVSGAAANSNNYTNISGTNFKKSTYYLG